MSEPTPYGPLALDAGRGPVTRSYWVIEGRLAAGSHPAQRGVGDELVARLEEEGVTVIVDLTDPVDTDVPFPDYTDLLVDARRQSYPITDMEVPTAVGMMQILDAIDAALDDGEGVYVHCHAGVGRTGTVVGCWLVRHGIDPDRAIEVLDRLRRQDRSYVRLASPQTAEQARMVEGWPTGR